MRATTVHATVHATVQNTVHATSTSRLLPDEILFLILQKAAHRFDNQLMLKLRLINHEQASLYSLVAKTHHRDKSVQARAILEACFHPVFQDLHGYCFLYDRVFNMCSKRGVHNGCYHLYIQMDGFVETCCASGQIPWKQMKRFAHIFMYLDRFYAHRLNNTPVRTLVSSACVKHGLVSQEDANVWLKRE